MGGEVSKGTQGEWRVEAVSEQPPKIVASGLGRFRDTSRTVATMEDNSILSHEDAEVIVEAVRRLRTEPNAPRRGLAELLAHKPGLAITRLDWQLEQTAWAMNILTRESEQMGTGPAGPWVCVDFEDGEKFAIWKRTGDVYEVDEHGAVGDDPLIEVAVA